MQWRFTFDPHNEIGDIVMVPAIFEIRDRKLKPAFLTDASVRSWVWL